MNRLKQKSTWAGLLTIALSIIGLISGTASSDTAIPAIVTGVGLIGVDA